MAYQAAPNAENVPATGSEGSSSDSTNSQERIVRAQFPVVGRWFKGMWWARCLFTVMVLVAGGSLWGAVVNLYRAQLQKQALDFQQLRAELRAELEKNKTDPCTALLAERSQQMMRPYEFELPKHYVKRTVLETKLAAMVEYGRKPGSEGRLIVVLGRRQIGKTRLILGHFRGQENVYYHSAAKAAQLGEDKTQACGDKFPVVLVKEIIYEAYQKNKGNLAVIFDVPHDAEKADVQQVYENLKTIVYDDPKRHPVLGVLILSNHYMVDAFPKDKNRYEELWVGNLERSEAEEYLDKLHGDRELLNTMGAGLSELMWAERQPKWKWSVEQAVETAMYNKNARTLMKMIADSGADGINGTRLRNTEDDHKLPLDDLFVWVRQFSNVFYFDRQRGAFVFVSPYHQWVFGHPDHRTEL